MTPARTAMNSPRLIDCLPDKWRGGSISPKEWVRQAVRGAIALFDRIAVYHARIPFKGRTCAPYA
jgi:hypothetical protein